MSVLHVLPKANSKESNIKFREFRNTSKAPFVIYADFEFLLEPLHRQSKQIHYSQWNLVCGAAAILCSYIPEMNNEVAIFTGRVALEDFLTS